MVARTQDLVPFARLGPCSVPEMWRAVYAERRGFEYWGHAASWLPMAEYRYFRPRMAQLPGAPPGVPGGARRPAGGRAGPHPGRGPARRGRVRGPPPGAGDVVGLEAGQAGPGGALRRRRPELRRAHGRLRPALRPDRAGAARRPGYLPPGHPGGGAAPAAPGDLRPGRGHRPRSGRLLPAHPYLRAHLEGLPPGAGRPARGGRGGAGGGGGLDGHRAGHPAGSGRAASACPSTAPPS